MCKVSGRNGWQFPAGKHLVPSEQLDTLIDHITWQRPLDEPRPDLAKKPWRRYSRDLGACIESLIGEGRIEVSVRWDRKTRLHCARIADYDGEYRDGEGFSRKPALAVCLAIMDHYELTPEILALIQSTAVPERVT